MAKTIVLTDMSRVYTPGAIRSGKITEQDLERMMEETRERLREADARQRGGVPRPDVWKMQATK